MGMNRQFFSISFLYFPFPAVCLPVHTTVQERPSPIMNTSAKTNLGHLEASAGMAGAVSFSHWATAQYFDV